MIHPEKSVVVTKGRSKKVLEEEKSLTLGNKQITLADQTKHLGLIRSVKQESKNQHFGKNQFGKENSLHTIKCRCSW